MDVIDEDMGQDDIKDNNKVINWKNLLTNGSRGF